MITTFKTYKNNTIALKVQGGVSCADINFFTGEFAKKLAEGHDRVNVFIIIADLEVKSTSLRAAWQERVWGAKNLQSMGKVAIVGNKRPFNWLKNAVLLEAWILMTLNSSANEKYFDISDLEKAITFIES